MSTRSEKSCQWNAAEYAANSAVQQSWAREVIARLHLRGDERVLDVGCGDGKVTAEIARAVPRGSVLGLDASPEMIVFAQKTFPPAKISNLKFQIGDAREINKVLSIGAKSKPGAAGVSVSLNKARPHPGPLSQGEGETVAASRQDSTLSVQESFDLVFSNAALHWVDDHEAFLRGAASVLKPGGRLVVSCGGKGNAQDVFLALRPELRLQRWRKFFRKIPAPYFFYSPAQYQKWLPKFGFKINDVKLAPKDATYAGADGFATWVRTTWLPYVQRVPGDLREDFIAAVTRRYLAKHPLDVEGNVHVRMVRLEIDAEKT